MTEKAYAPDVDLDRMTVPQLTALISAARAKREGKLEEAKAALRAEMERKAAELGIVPGDLFPGERQRAWRENGAPRARWPDRDAAPAERRVKYRGPNGETWSGRGRTPKWLKALAAEGRGREDFLVQG